MEQSPHEDEAEIDSMCLQNGVPATQKKKASTAPSDENEAKRKIKQACLGPTEQSSQEEKAEIDSMRLRVPTTQKKGKYDVQRRKRKRRGKILQ